MRPPARAIAGHLIWSADGGVWGVWSIKPFAHAHTGIADKLAVHAQIRGLLVSLPPDSMLLSVCERLDPGDVVARMASGIDLDQRRSWATVCDASVGWLAQVPLRGRLYYVAVALPGERRPLLAALRNAVADLHAAVGLAPRAIPVDEVEQRRQQARQIEVRLAQHVSLRPATAGEVCWLYARALRREVDEPPYDERWEPPAPDPGVGGIEGIGGTGAPAGGRPPTAVLAHLTDALVREGGASDDADRPRHRRYVRIENPGGTSFQTVMAMSDMPHFFAFPGGSGEWLYHVDGVGFPVDWCVRVRTVGNAEAQAKVRRKHRDLVGQVGEYDTDLIGAPPQLAEAIRAIDDERTELGANPSEPELQVTILLSVAAASLPELEDRATALASLFEPQEYALARPTGGQAALLRSMLPGTAPAPVCRDYTQFMLARDLAGGSPFCGTGVGDPEGLLLGVSLDAGTGTPVLFDPAFGPQVNASPSLAAVGRLGSGKSFFLKRLCWDTVARGGQVVTIDRTQSGEYAAFARAGAGQAQVVRLEAGSDVCLDPLVSFGGEERTAVALGFLSLLAGCSAHSDEGAALAEAVDTVAARADARLGDVVDELARMGNDALHPDAAAKSVARRLSHHRRSPTGQLAFGQGSQLSLDADFIVFWAPHLALPDRDTLQHHADMMLPEEVLGQALLYLVAAVGRRVVFADPTRFAAALYDEAWALLASPHGQRLLVEGVRDGRKHNGAIWLASQHPNDFAISELEDLLGSRFVFDQARQAIPAALRFLGVADSVDTRVTLEQRLGTGVCLYRDVRDRLGLIQVLPPALPEIDPLFNTRPGEQPPIAELGTGGPDHPLPPTPVDPPALAPPEPPVLAPADPPLLAPAARPVVPPADPPVLAPTDPAVVAPADPQDGSPRERPPAAADPTVGARRTGGGWARIHRRTPLAAALAEGDPG
jgi:hypothetical protein